jgi:hypothetical protein
MSTNSPQNPINQEIQNRSQNKDLPAFELPLPANSQQNQTNADHHANEPKCEQARSSERITPDLVIVIIIFTIKQENHHKKWPQLEQNFQGKNDKNQEFAVRQIPQFLDPIFLEFENKGQ